MADIQQWRKKIQPARTRTPAVEVEEADDLPPPNTPKQCLKSKVSSYFDFRGPKTTSFTEDVGLQLPSWPVDQLYPGPNVLDELDSVMCVLMSEPHMRLDIRFNSALMRIFEAFLSIEEEKEHLQRCLSQEAMAYKSLLSKYNMAEKDWEDEKQDYKDEVKRLEVLLSKTSKCGLAEVTLARQDSKLRSRISDNKRKETIFEFLEKSQRFDDRFYNNQRATMKPLLQSSSVKDKKTSQMLAQKKSMISIHPDLPFGTPPGKPPGREMQFSLTSMSMLEQQIDHNLRTRALTCSSSTSVETLSVFSCEGSALPKETVEPNFSSRETSDSEDLAEIVRIATTVALRRNLDPGQMVPQLLNLFQLQGNRPADGVVNSMPCTLDIHVSQAVRPVATARVLFEGAGVKRQSVMSKATGIFNRFRPQLSVDNGGASTGGNRRFSFEPGGDVAAQNLPLEATPYSNQDRILRKSASMDALPKQTSAQAIAGCALSPVEASPTTVSAVERASSRIPTPMYSSGSLARPRQDREDSASSLLTAIKMADGNTKRSNSLSSSAYRSPSLSRDDTLKPTQSDPTLSFLVRARNSNVLLNHTNALRGQHGNSVAPRAAGMPANPISGFTMYKKQSAPRGDYNALHVISDEGEPRSRNARLERSGGIASDNA